MLTSGLQALQSMPSELAREEASSPRPPQRGRTWSSVRKSPLLATWVSAHIMACLAPEVSSTTTITRFLAAAAMASPGLFLQPLPVMKPLAAALFLDHRREPLLLLAASLQPYSPCCPCCSTQSPSLLALSCLRKCSPAPLAIYQLCSPFPHWLAAQCAMQCTPTHCPRWRVGAKRRGVLCAV
uniref:Uncharacterized protein n=1 Tax=Arundo donax TaxID=35708 RepID=A0A0A9CGM9_ARUDO